MNQMLREEAGRFIKIAKRIVGEMPEPWTWKPRERGLDKILVGHPPMYDARSMIVLCLFKVYSDHAFRWLEGFLRDNQSLCHELGFEDGCPSYETIRRAMLHVDESYLRSLNKKILAELKKRRLKVSIDSTSVGTKLFDRWLSHPTDRSKDFVKLHAAIDDRGVAFPIAITDGTTSDTTLFPYLMGDIDAPVSVVRADKGYLSRDNVQLVEDMGAIPYIKPKSSSTMKSKGRLAWRHMHFRYRQDKDAFHQEYNQQRRAEAFFSRMKRRFGSSVRSRIGTMRRREVWMRVLILNMLAVASEEVEQELAAMAG